MPTKRDLQKRPATYCNTLQHNVLQHTATRRNTLQHTATHCDTLQHTATHCNTLQQTAGAFSILGWYAHSGFGRVLRELVSRDTEMDT